AFGGLGRRLSRHAPDTLLDALQGGTKIPAMIALQKLQTAGWTTATAVVVSFAKFVGVLEPVGPATHRTRLVTLVKNLFIHTQCTKNLRPPAVTTRLQLVQTRFEFQTVHDALRFG